MGLFSWFKRDKKKKATDQELEAQYDAQLDPSASAKVAPPPVAAPAPVVAPPPVVSRPPVAAPAPVVVPPPVVSAPPKPVAPAVQSPVVAPKPVAASPVVVPPVSAKPSVASSAPVVPPKPVAQPAPVSAPKPVPVAAPPVVPKPPMPAVTPAVPVTPTPVVPVVSSVAPPVAPVTSPVKAPIAGQTLIAAPKPVEAPTPLMAKAVEVPIEPVRAASAVAPIAPKVEAPKPVPVAPAPAPVVPAPAPAPVPQAPVPAPVAKPVVQVPAPAPVAKPAVPVPAPAPAPVQEPPKPAPVSMGPAPRQAVATKPSLMAQAPAAPEPEAPAKPKGFFGRLKTAVSKTRMILSRKVAGIIGLGKKIDEDLLDQLEEALIEADMGVDTTSLLMDDIRKAWKNGDIETGDDIFPFLKADLKHRLAAGNTAIRTATSGPTVILVVGVNGAGKTTSIAKMARIHVLEGNRVLLAAGDTFRAAAVEQLVTWSTRIGCEVVTGKQNQDPAAVAYTACERAVKENYDILLIDTAGRLHTQKNLMDELSKIHKVIGKVIPGAPHETIMVLDATTGQNAINQARMFREVADVSGIFLAKLDGTAKGGSVLTIDRQAGIPVKYVGVGESFEDVQRFNAHAFVDALFDDTELGGRDAA